nr:MAG TPA: hypothetical protein [Bacteriophage sp.]
MKGYFLCKNLTFFYQKKEEKYFANSKIFCIFAM